MERTSTVEPLPGLDPSRDDERRRLRRYRLLRRLVIGVVAVVVVLGALGLLGVRSETVSARGEGYELTVTYPRVARGALSAPWKIEVTHPGGFDGPITITTSREWFELFDLNGLFPAPSAETSGPELVEWEFDPPTGDTLTVYNDSRIGPNVNWGKGATTSLVVDDEVVVSVDYHTWVLP